MFEGFVFMSSSVSPLDFNAWLRGESTSDDQTTLDEYIKGCQAYCVEHGEWFMTPHPTLHSLCCEPSDRPYDPYLIEQDEIDQIVTTVESLRAQLHEANKQLAIQTKELQKLGNENTQLYTKLQETRAAYVNHYRALVRNERVPSESFQVLHAILLSGVV